MNTSDFLVRILGNPRTKALMAATNFTDG